MSRLHVTAASAGAFVTALAGTLAIIGIVPLGALPRAVTGSLLFVPLWVGLGLMACLAADARRAWRQQLLLGLGFGLLAAVTLGIRS